MAALYGNRGGYGRRRGGSLIFGLIIAAIALFSYFGTEKIYNPVTGENQRISLSKEDEIALGLQAAPSMAQQFGGLDKDPEHQTYVDKVGKRIVSVDSIPGNGWNFEFHALADNDTINAFALPGGQVFITRGLLKLLRTEDQLAGVLAHEVGHVIARHGAEHLAKQQLTQGLTSAAVVASGDYNTGQLAAVIGQLVGMRYGRQDELESDRLGVRFMTKAGYEPSAMIEVMQILTENSGPNRQPEFFSTHPNPENRIENIKEAIKEYAAKSVTMMVAQVKELSIIQ